MEYFVFLDGIQTGPLSDIMIAQMITDRKVAGDTLAWHDGLPGWQTADTIPDLVPFLTGTPASEETKPPGVAALVERDGQCRMIVVGRNGQIEFDGNSIIITRKGMLGFLTQGLSGARTIQVSSLTSVVFRAAGKFSNGYIQFTFQGGREALGGILNAAKDENAVMFLLQQQEPFEQLRVALQQARDSRAGSKTTATISVTDELEKLGRLLASGVLTQEEFQNHKAKLLAGSHNALFPDTRLSLS